MNGFLVLINMWNECYRNSAVRTRTTLCEPRFQSTKIGKTMQMGIPISGPKNWKTESGFGPLNDLKSACHRSENGGNHAILHTTYDRVLQN